MNKNSRRRPRKPLMLQGFYEEELLNRFLRLYSEDERFIEAFLAFERAHRDVFTDIPPYADEINDLWSKYGLPWPYIEAGAKREQSPRMMEYVDALNHVVERWGLAALPEFSGHDAFHHALIWRLRFPDYPIRLSFNTPHQIPIVPGEVVDPYRPRRIAILLEATVYWHYEDETPQEAFERLIPEVSQSLQNHIDAAEHRVMETDYVYPPDPTEMHRHLGWLYRRIAYREHCWRIAESIRQEDDAQAGIPEQYVRKRTDQYAKLLGIRMMNVRARDSFTP